MFCRMTTLHESYCQSPKGHMSMEGIYRDFVALFDLFFGPLERYRTKEQLSKTNQFLKTLGNTLKNDIFDPFVSCQKETYVFHLCKREVLVRNLHISPIVVKKYKILEIWVVWVVLELPPHL